MQFYTKDQDDFVEATDEQIDELFRERSDKIVKARLAKAREKDAIKIREEIEADVRQSIEEDVRKQTKEELEQEYRTKLDEANARASELDVTLRQNNIAMEYGFNQKVAKLLGKGSDDEMRAVADDIRDSFSAGKLSAPDKSTEETVSKMQAKTGVKVTI